MTTPAERAERICVLAKASRTGLRGGTHQSCHECANVIREIEEACEEALGGRDPSDYWWDMESGFMYLL